MFYFDEIETAVGTLHLVTDEKAVHVVAFSDTWPQLKMKFSPSQDGANPLMNKLKKQIQEYFSGQRKEFDLPMSFEGTEFQKAAWVALTKVGYGETWSYQRQAESIGSPKAVRAIGGANGKNPLCLLLPCHRIIAKSGQLQGFAADIQIKERLLALEQSFLK